MRVMGDVAFILGGGSAAASSSASGGDGPFRRRATAAPALPPAEAAKKKGPSRELAGLLDDKGAAEASAAALAPLVFVKPPVAGLQFKAKRGAAFGERWCVAPPRVRAQPPPRCCPAVAAP